MSGLSGSTKVFIIIVVLVIAASIAITSFIIKQNGSDGTIEVTLSVYSGRPNPQWQIEKGKDQDKLVRTIRDLELEDKPIFNYDEWNRLGYASFWIVPEGVEDLPYAIHIWRDMAYVVPDRDGEAMYARGATTLYDLLVEQAEKREQGEFFVNYRNTK